MPELCRLFFSAAVLVGGVVAGLLVSYLFVVLLAALWGAARGLKDRWEDERAAQDCQASATCSHSGGLDDADAEDAEALGSQLRRRWGPGSWPGRRP